MADGDPILTGNNIAEMYQHEQVTETTIQEDDEWHLVKEFSQGVIGAGWTFGAGQQLAITAFASSDGGAKTQVTVAGHGMSDGDIISIANTANYDGVFVIEQVATDTFVIAQAFNGDDGASTGEQGSYLKCNAVEAEGTYEVEYSVSVTPAQNGNVMEATIFHNATYKINMEIQRKMGTAADYGVGGSGGYLTISNGDIITLAIENLSAAQDITVRNANVRVHKVG